MGVGYTFLRSLKFSSIENMGLIMSDTRVDFSTEWTNSEEKKKCEVKLFCSSVRSNIFVHTSVHNEGEQQNRQLSAVETTNIWLILQFQNYWNNKNYLIGFSGWEASKNKVQTQFCEYWQEPITSTFPATRDVIANLWWGLPQIKV